MDTPSRLWSSTCIVRPCSQHLPEGVVCVTFTLFYGLAELAALTQVVPKAQLSQALTQNEMLYSTVSLAAPPLGTFLLSLSRLLPFVVDAISYVVLLISLFFIRTSFQEERVETKGHLLKDIREGLGWVWRQPVVRFLIAGCMLFLLVIFLELNIPSLFCHSHLCSGFPHYFPMRRATTGAKTSALSSNTEIYEMPYFSRLSCKASLIWLTVPIRQCGIVGTCSSVA